MLATLTRHDDEHGVLSIRSLGIDNTQTFGRSLITLNDLIVFLTTLSYAYNNEDHDEHKQLLVELTEFIDSYVWRWEEDVYRCYSDGIHSVTTIDGECLNVDTELMHKINRLILRYPVLFVNSMLMRRNCKKEITVHQPDHYTAMIDLSSRSGVYNTFMTGERFYEPDEPLPEDSVGALTEQIRTTMRTREWGRYRTAISTMCIQQAKVLNRMYDSAKCIASAERSKTFKLAFELAETLKEQGWILDGSCLVYPHTIYADTIITNGNRHVKMPSHLSHTFYVSDVSIRIEDNIVSARASGFHPHLSNDGGGICLGDLSDEPFKRIVEFVDMMRYIYIPSMYDNEAELIVRYLEGDVSYRLDDYRDAKYRHGLYEDYVYDYGEPVYDEEDLDEDSDKPIAEGFGPEDDDFYEDEEMETLIDAGLVDSDYAYIPSCIDNGDYSEPLTAGVTYEDSDE